MAAFLAPVQPSSSSLNSGNPALVDLSSPSSLSCGILLHGNQSNERAAQSKRISHRREALLNDRWCFVSGVDASSASPASIGVSRPKRFFLTALSRKAPEASRAASCTVEANAQTATAASATAPVGGKKLRVGLIGSGRIGIVHSETISYRVPEAEVVQIADPFIDGARKLGERLGGIPAVEDFRELLANKDIDAVMVCSPSDTHAEVIKAAAAAGKHIFCEKPISLRLDIIDECLAAVDKAGVKFFLAFQRRFDPDFKKLHDTIKDGGIGDVFHVHTISRDPAPPPITYVKGSGGIFMDMAIHDFDMLRYLTLSDPVEVFARGAVRIDPAIGEVGDYDSAVTMVTFANGAIGVVDNCRKSGYGYDQRAEVFGSKGNLSIENKSATSVKAWGADAIKGPLPLNFFMDRYLDAYQAEVSAFVDCVVNDKEPPTTGLDGRKAALIALAAARSAAENRPVKISEVDV